MADPALSKDFDSACKFAWKVYKSCQDAGWAFDDVARAVISLHSRLLDFTHDTSRQDWNGRRCADDRTAYGQLTVDCMQTLQSLDTLLITYKNNHKHRSRRRQWGDVSSSAPEINILKEKLGAHTSTAAEVASRLKPAEGREERVSARNELLDDKAGKKFDAPAQMAVGIDIDSNGGKESAQAIWANLLRQQSLVMAGVGGSGGSIGGSSGVFGNNTKCEPKTGPGGLGFENRGGGIF